MARLAVVGIVLVFVAICAWRTIGSRARHSARRISQPIQLYSDPPGIVLHSSLSPGKVQGIPINAARLEQIHADDHPHWATTFEGKVYHIGYHYVILPDGTIEQGRPDHCIGCHAPHFNTWLGICVIGCFDPSVHHHWKPSRPTAKQIASVIALCERLMSKYHIPPENVLRHRDTKQTWCPGRRFPYAAIIAQLHRYAELHAETRAPRVIASGAAPEGLAAAGEGR